MRTGRPIFWKTREFYTLPFFLHSDGANQATCQGRIGYLSRLLKVLYNVRIRKRHFKANKKYNFSDSPQELIFKLLNKSLRFRIVWCKYLGTAPNIFWSFVYMNLGVRIWRHYVKSQQRILAFRKYKWLTDCLSLIHI